MAKRGAAIQLTDRNWNEEDEPEQAGYFKQAGNEEINKRVIKKAKRKIAGSESAGGFKSFQGFGNPSSTTSPATTTFTGFKGFGDSSQTPENKANNIETNSNSNEALAANSGLYLKQLKALNQSVCEWIKKHVSQDPFVDLSPVFKDYEKHLENIDKKFSKRDKTSNLQLGAKVTNNALSTEQPKTVRFGGTIGHSTPVSPLVTSINGGNSSSLVAEATQSKSCDMDKAPDDTAKTDSQVRSSPEQDAFYSTRCKLFFKRADSWAELGVGMLSLKTVNDKTQVLIRNDTSLGKILLNIYLGAATPVSRSGKNNVLLMSIPNPPVFTKESDGDNTKPVSYLIRVKTSDSADDLHKQMEKSSSA